ncbi:MAG: hypothetical protein ACOYKB_03125 [Succiniclasticum sp.]|jgi:hypothetical protein
MLDFRESSPTDILAALKRLWIRQSWLTVLVGVIGCILLSGGALRSWVCALAWSVLDVAVVLVWAWYSTLHPERARSLLNGMRITRVSLAVIFVCSMLRLRLTAAPLLIGFILLHIIFIFNLLNFTRRKNHTDIRRP